MRIGYLSLQREEGDESWVAAFRQGLRELGYVVGRNVAIEQRHAAGRSDRLPELASELVRLKIDVLVVYGLIGTLAGGLLAAPLAAEAQPAESSWLGGSWSHIPAPEREAGP